MAVTVANVAHPNTNVWEGDLLGLKARIVDVTFDAAYLTTGELLTADALGWDVIHGVIPMTLATNTAGTLSYAVQGRPNAARSQIALQLYAGPDLLGALPEVASAADASTYTARLLVLGT